MWVPNNFFFLVGAANELQMCEWMNYIIFQSNYWRCFKLFNVIAQELQVSCAQVQDPLTRYFVWWREKVFCWLKAYDDVIHVSNLNKSVNMNCFWKSCDKGLFIDHYLRQEKFFFSKKSKKSYIHIKEKQTREKKIIIRRLRAQNKKWFWQGRRWFQFFCFYRDHSVELDSTHDRPTFEEKKKKIFFSRWTKTLIEQL